MNDLHKALAETDLDGPPLEEGEILADVVILCRLMKANEHHSALAIYASTNTDAIVQSGLISTAAAMLAAAPND